jgi:putative hydrolase of the HAD superfamily
MFGISFDFWNTLFGNGDEPLRYKRRFEYFHHVISTYTETDRSSIENAFRESTKFFIHEWQNNFRTPTAPERIQYMADFLSVDIEKSDIEKIADFFGQLIFSIPPEVNTEDLEIFCQLSENYPIGLISDTGYISGKYIRKFLAEHDLISNFTSLVFSDEQRHSKPHPSVFELTCQKLEVSCAKLIHIGDLEKTDIKGAHTSGGIAIKYTGWNDNASDHSLADYIVHDYQNIKKTIDQIVNS